MALPTINGLALCAGVGMLDEGVRLAFEHLGWNYRTVAYVEREAFAASQLVALMESGCLDQAPVWSDLTTFDTRPWVGLVDCVTAGFPCQPHSVAGKREGLADERWIWPDVARLIGELRPRFVLLENVPGLASSGGLDACIGDLAVRGYDAEWARLSAAAVGASHERERLFILAWLADAGLQQQHIQQRRAWSEYSGDGNQLENAARYERPRLLGEGGRRRGVREAGNKLAYANCARSQERNGGGCNDDPLRAAERPDAFSIRRTFAPGPGDEVWEAYCSFFPYLAPAVESGVCVLANGVAFLVDESRTDQLRAIGNGVVALSAACAYVELARRAGVRAA